MDKLKDLYEKQRALSIEIFSAMQDELKPGTEITWKRGNYRQWGRVIAVVGHSGSPGVQVRNVTTGKIILLSYYDVVKGQYPYVDNPYVRGTEPYDEFNRAHKAS